MIALYIESSVSRNAPFSILKDHQLLNCYIECVNMYVYILYNTINCIYLW